MLWSDVFVEKIPGIRASISTVVIDPGTDQVSMVNVMPKLVRHGEASPEIVIATIDGDLVFSVFISNLPTNLRVKLCFPNQLDP